MDATFLDLKQVLLSAEQLSTKTVEIKFCQRIHKPREGSRRREDNILMNRLELEVESLKSLVLLH